MHGGSLNQLQKASKSITVLSLCFVLHSYLLIFLQGSVGDTIREHRQVGLSGRTSF